MTMPGRTPSPNSPARIAWQCGELNGTKTMVPMNRRLAILTESPDIPRSYDGRAMERGQSQEDWLRIIALLAAVLKPAVLKRTDLKPAVLKPAV
jgi:hypothetical protein